MLGKANEILRRIYYLSFAYRISGNESYANRALDDNNYLTIIDSIFVGSNPITIKWVMVTDADAHVENQNTVLLKKNGQAMRLAIDTDVATISKIWSDNPMHSYDQMYDNTVRVGYEMELPPNRQTVLKVSLSPIQLSKSIS